MTLDNDLFLEKLVDGWFNKREEEAATMCAKRKLTDNELERALVIAKWFLGWTNKVGPCPIKINDEYWYKKLCSLFEWIAVLETLGNVKERTK